MTNKSKVEVVYPGWILGVMFLILFTLKLLGHVTFSWWWVTAPLWLPISLYMTIVITALVAVLVYAYCMDLIGKK